VFVGNELQADTGREGRLALRFRPDGHLDYLWRGAAGAWGAGVIHRATPADPSAGVPAVEALPTRLVGRWQTDTAPNISIGQGSLELSVESQNGFEVIGRFTQSGGGNHPCNYRSEVPFRGFWDGQRLAVRTEGRFGCDERYFFFRRGTEGYLDNDSGPAWRSWLDPVR
jgi:hypothetical protein